MVPILGIQVFYMKMRLTGLEKSLLSDSSQLPFARGRHHQERDSVLGVLPTLSPDGALLGYMHSRQGSVFDLPLWTTYRSELVPPDITSHYMTA